MTIYEVYKFCMKIVNSQLCCKLILQLISKIKQSQEADLEFENLKIPSSHF